MQFGRTLERLLRHIVLSNPKFGPVYLLKIDLADGFYRVWLRLADVPKLAVSVPHLLLALPLALPMGWTESPPYFCAVTETIADVANIRLLQRKIPPPHRLDRLADTLLPPEPPQQAFNNQPSVPANPLLRQYGRMLATTDVFVDDFVAAAQGPRPRRMNTRRTLMHAIDDVFRPLQLSDPPARTEPISTSKLCKGDACWATRKKILGWIIDTVDMTITLPANRVDRLHTLLDSIPPSQHRLSLAKFHQLLGELRSMSLALPGARGLFSHLQAALHSRTHGQLRLTAGFHQALDDFRWLATELHSRPTRLYELVPTAPTLLGFHDAARPGAGGVWFPHPTSCPRLARFHILEPSGHFHRVRPHSIGPVAWRMPFPAHITSQLASTSNPQGSINNSQLELVGAHIHDEVAAQCFDTRERTIQSKTDNLSTLFWDRRGSVTTTSATATILRQQALHQRFHQYVKLKDYIPGVLNVMADDASRLFHLTDHEFLAHFNSTYPQEKPWRLYTVNPTFSSSVILALQRKKSQRESFLLAPAKPLPTGRNGWPTAPPSPSILPFKGSWIPYPSSKFLPGATAMVSLTPRDDKSAVEPWRMPYTVLPKRSLHWGPRTHAAPQRAKLTLGYNECLLPTAKLTHPPTG